LHTTTFVIVGMLLLLVLSLYYGYFGMHVGNMFSEFGQNVFVLLSI